MTHPIPPYPFSQPTPGEYDALAPLRDAAKTYTEAAIDLCAPFGLRPTCHIVSDRTGLHLDIEVRDLADELQFTALGVDPLIDLKRQLPQSHTAACEAQRRSIGFQQRQP